MTVSGGETPPLTRGRQLANHKYFYRLGNTPAYAGKTSEARAAEAAGIGNTPAYAGKTTEEDELPLKSRKHPRLRGEDEKQSVQSRTFRETPPLTRGRLEKSVFDRLSERNTPAYAGKTAKCGVGRLESWKHPRLRGEDVRIVWRYPSVLETPPLTRGRPQAQGPLGCYARNTPAYAGKTTDGPKLLSHDRKHPRLRGEDLATSSPSL